MIGPELAVSARFVDDVQATADDQRDVGGVRHGSSSTTMIVAGVRQCWRIQGRRTPLRTLERSISSLEQDGSSSQRGELDLDAAGFWHIAQSLAGDNVEQFAIQLLVFEALDIAEIEFFLYGLS